MAFRLCPICELNYIDDDAAQMCDVCFSARNGSKSTDEILCPVCKMHVVNANEDMCSDCRRESLYEETENGVIFSSADIDDTAIDDMELPSVSDDAIPPKDFEEISKEFEDDASDESHDDTDE